MSKKINPFIFRVILNRNWNSVWYIRKRNFSNYLIEDLIIKDLIKKFFFNIVLGKIMIFKNSNFIFISIYIKKTNFLDKINIFFLKKKIFYLTKKLVFLNFKNIINPNLNVNLLIFYIKKNIELRKPYKNVIRNIIRNSFKCRCLGLKIIIQGRINGNVMTRKQIFKQGKIPLQRICSNIRYCSDFAKTIYGIIGIKIWLYLGDFVY